MISDKTLLFIKITRSQHKMNTPILSSSAEWIFIFNKPTLSNELGDKCYNTEYRKIQQCLQIWKFVCLTLGLTFASVSQRIVRCGSFPVMLNRMLVTVVYLLFSVWHLGSYFLFVTLTLWWFSRLTPHNATRTAGHYKKAYQRHVHSF